MKDKLFFENSKGIRLCGILSNPTNETEKAIMVLCHGFATSKDGNTYIRLEETLNEKEISIFRFDLFGHGESDGKLEDLTISEAVDDVLCAIRFLKESGYKKIGLLGSSFGGMASLLAALKRDDLYVLALKSPVSDYPSLLSLRDKEEIEAWKQKGFIYFTSINGEEIKLNYSFYEDAIKANAHESAHKIKCPTLIVHGDKDKIVPVEQSKKIARSIENCRLEIIEGADHTYSIPEHFEMMLDMISGFIIRNS
jgi:pimeloyl-ACP methyl ester carboxylesterase